jgi:hypothetical protein
MIGDEVQNPLPKDTKFIRYGYDSFGNLMMVIESDEFPLVDIQGEIPAWGVAGDMFFKKHQSGLSS